MADLEKLLLEAAGRPAGSGRDKHSHQSSRSRHQDPYPDDDSDSKDDEDSDDGRGYAGRKPSRAHVPLKKRSKRRSANEGTDEDEDDNLGSDHEIDNSDDSDVGSDLYKDEEDREQLAKMTELERELILHERAAKKDDKKLQKQMKSRMESEKKIRPRKETPGLRTSARFADRTPAKSNALNELKARRMKRESDTKGREFSNMPSTGSPKGKKRFATSSPAGSSDSDSGSEFQSEDDGSVGDGRTDYSDDEKDKTEIEKPTFEDIVSITVKRSKLAKWFMDPFFEELMVGCFVRVGIGVKSGQNVYRLCIVQNVDSSDANQQYQLENKMTRKYLNCIWGVAEAKWQMARISESPPSEEEFNYLVREVERTGGSMPTRKQVLEKKDEIEKINNYVYNAATVKQMLQEKKTVSTRPLNIAAEKEKLRREMEVAQERGDEAEIERIKTRLHELGASRHAREKDEKALKLAEMNRKNRAENFRVASVSKPVNTTLKAGDAGYDPFSRRWTRSRNYYVAKNKSGSGSSAPAAAVESDGGGSGAGAVAVADNSNGSMATTKAALEAAAGAGKLVDTDAPVDQGTMFNMLHNFELPISLATLQKFGGAYGVGNAFLARKQHIEGTIGSQFPVEDGKRHLLILSLGDYKRRRGLL